MAANSEQFLALVRKYSCFGKPFLHSKGAELRHPAVSSDDKSILIRQDQIQRSRGDRRATVDLRNLTSRLPYAQHARQQNDQSP